MIIKKDQINLNVAGFIIKINLFPSEWLYSKEKFIKELNGYYRDFISKEINTRSDFTIDVIEQRNFVFYYQDNFGLIEIFKNKKKNHLITYYQLSLIQFQLLVNNAIHYLLEKNNGLVLHASANNVKGNAVIFLGSSGCGKSTIMKLLHPVYPALADDSIILRKISDTYFVFQTPTKEKESWVKKSSNCYLLKKVFFLGKKSISFHIAQIKERNTIFKLLTRQLIFNQFYSKRMVFQLMDLLKEKHLFYSVQFLKKRNLLLDLLKKANI